MTSTDSAPVVGDPRPSARERSRRDKFEFYQAAPIFAAAAAARAQRTGPAAEGSGMDCSDLIAKFGEEAVHAKLAELAEASGGGGGTTTILYQQPPPEGWGLVHAWFGPGYLLPRHTHPLMGDCLYYVLAGQAILGSRVLNAGDGFYVPNEHPYKFRAGPDGLEILEFRGGYGIKGAPLMKCHETTLEAFDKMIEAARDNRDQWTAPDGTSDNPLLMKPPV